jgi:hypothetical protein
MKLDSLERFDSATANGVLAAAALASGPDPGVGERPLVLRTYSKEAAELLAEIRSRLGISGDADTPEVRASMSKVLAEALRQSMLSDAAASEALQRVGAAGRLAPAAYNVIQSPEFREVFYGLGVRPNYVEDAVKRPDDHQHLMTEGMPETLQDMSLFMKRVMSQDFRKRHWLLVQSHRVGTDQRVGAAWQVFPQDVNIELAGQPLDVLKAFVEVYGVPVKVGTSHGLFIEPTLYPPGTAVKLDWTGAPQDCFVSTLQTTDAAGYIRVGITYCIYLPRYRAALRSHGVKVADQSGPAGTRIVATTTLRPR